MVEYWNVGPKKDMIYFLFYGQHEVDINPAFQYPQTHYSIVPSFQYSI